ncbi:MAG: cobalamin biosynthesis bifunctional protein CbiET [Gammaproteobacteria bacterium]|nr:MAG: cobalamin biosynthesis bifunctional protein CbiET [Gammaproteobacteria bacterium]
MPLHVIGLGVAEQANLDRPALVALQSADRVIGAERQLHTVRRWLSDNQRIELLPKLLVLQKQLAIYLKQGESIALLASGDPLFFGIGKWVQNTFPDQHQVSFYPGLSSIQVACHRLGWSLQDVEVISLHGRPPDTLVARLQPNKRYVLLTDQHSSAQAIARVCFQRGFESALLTVCEKLGYTNERVRQFSLVELVDGAARQQLFDPLNVVCLQTLESTGYIPQFPGISDSRFVTDKSAGKGMMTKREVRLAILSWLQPSPVDCIWDIGAGCGGVAIELAFWSRERGQGAQVYGIEHHPERIACLQQNRQRFGVDSNLHIVAGRAPEICHGLPLANKVFIGGSGGELPEILDLVWQRLVPGGIIVASAVTEPTRQQLYGFYHSRFRQPTSQTVVFETLEIAVSRGETLAGDLYYRPHLPVTLYKLVKLQDLADD